MTLGYIVTNRKINGVNGFVEQVSSIEQADSTKPILIIGLNNAKKHQGYKTILDKKLDENVFWTFSKTESRSEQEEDLKKFYKLIINNILNNIKYYYINIIKLKYNKLKKLINIINSNDRKNIYISNGFIYIPYKGDILGLSLKILKYCGINNEKVINKIKMNPCNTVIEDNNSKILKLSRELGNKKYALPYFIS